VSLAIDLFCGLGGWTEGLLAEGYSVIGFDIERHAYGEAKYPAQLVIQDVLTIHGSQFKGASLIVASPPCQEFSYMAMPWTRAKEKARKLREDPEDRKRLTALFDACFRIQREAIAAAGHHIPMVVENVRGAQPWVGRARTHFGSFYLWGDVPALMPVVKSRAKVPGLGAGWRPPGHPDHKPGVSFNTEAEKTFRHVNKRDGHSHPRHLTNQREHDAVRDGRKAPTGTQWFNDGPRTPDSLASMGSKSTARKAASAAIAKIPPVLARWIAAYYKPEEQERVA